MAQSNPTLGTASKVGVGAPPAPAPAKRHQGAIARALLRMPLMLYRLRLGGLVSGFHAGADVTFGLLALTTRGRRTGGDRTTALEYREADGRYYMTAGWGPGSSWVLNLRQEPHVTVSVGRRRLAGRAHVVETDGDYESAFSVWRRSQPRLLRAFYRLFRLSTGRNEVEQRRLLRASTLVVVDTN
jgi:deazaflavin-dependent oxidoreductase (nitroreductase family)